MVLHGIAWYCIVCLIVGNDIFFSFFFAFTAPNHCLYHLCRCFYIPVDCTLPYLYLYSCCVFAFDGTRIASSCQLVWAENHKRQRAPDLLVNKVNNQSRKATNKQTNKENNESNKWKQKKLSFSEKRHTKK